MSDVEIVSADWFRNGHAEADSGRVPYGTIFHDDDTEQRDEQHGIEGLRDGAVPAVDWRGVDSDQSVKSVKQDPVKRKPGRPRKNGAE